MTVTLVKAECLSWLKEQPGKSVDCVITSPPYNVIRQSSGGGPNSRCKVFSARLREEWYPDSVDELEYQENQKAVVKELVRVCRGSVFYVHKVQYAWKRQGRMLHPLSWLGEFPIWCEIVWYKRGRSAGANNRRFHVQDERIYQIGKPHVWHDKGWSTVWRMTPPTPARSGHPCAFPEELARRCILATTDPGMTVLDPYAGSGTVGVVAALYGRHAVLVDLRYQAVQRQQLGLLTTVKEEVFEREGAPCS